MGVEVGRGVIDETIVGVGSGMAEGVEVGKEYPIGLHAPNIRYKAHEENSDFRIVFRNHSIQLTKSDFKAGNEKPLDSLF